jgi:hypothetical protein
MYLFLLSSLSSSIVITSTVVVVVVVHAQVTKQSQGQCETDLECSLLGEW